MNRRNLAVLLEIGLALLALILLALAHLYAVGVPFFGLPLILILAFILCVLLEDHLLAQQRALKGLLGGGRIVLFSLFLVQFASLYGGEAGVVLKAPTFAFYFALIALQGVRGGNKRILFTGGVAIGCWIIITFMATRLDTTVSLSFTYYMKSAATTWVAEAERLVALAAFTGAAALMRWPRQRRGQASDALRVLYIKDEKVDQEGRFGKGSEAIPCEDGAALLEMATGFYSEGKSVDIILLSVGQDEENAYDLCKALRRIERVYQASRSVIISVTDQPVGKSDSDQGQKMREAGFDGHVLASASQSDIWCEIYKAKTTRYFRS